MGSPDALTADLEVEITVEAFSPAAAGRAKSCRVPWEIADCSRQSSHQAPAPMLPPFLQLRLSSLGNHHMTRHAV